MTTISPNPRTWLPSQIPLRSSSGQPIRQGFDSRRTDRHSRRSKIEIAARLPEKLPPFPPPSFPFPPKKRIWQGRRRRTERSLFFSSGYWFWQQHFEACAQLDKPNHLLDRVYSTQAEDIQGTSYSYLSCHWFQSILEYFTLSSRPSPCQTRSPDCQSPPLYLHERDATATNQGHNHPDRLTLNPRCPYLPLRPPFFLLHSSPKHR